MFLKYFFAVFDDRYGPGFGSRFMKFLGTAFMGSPSSKSMGHLRKDIQDSYYYVPGDKIVPLPGKDLDEWRVQQTFVEQYKQVEAPQAALAVGICCVAIACAAVLLAAPFNATGCESVRKRVASGQIPYSEMTEKKVARCFDPGQSQ